MAESILQQYPARSGAMRPKSVASLTPSQAQRELQRLRREVKALRADVRRLSADNIHLRALKTTAADVADEWKRRFDLLLARQA